MNAGAPTFLILGAARCGTTALVEGLTTHPDVFVTDPKEPHYFALHGRSADFAGPGDAHTINKVAVTDADQYLALYPPEPHPYQCLGDAAVSSLYYYQEAIPEIRRLSPDAKLVILLRDPVERAHSAFSYLRARGFETHYSLMDAIRAEDQRVDAGWHHLWHYSRMSMYAHSVGAYLDAFGADQVGIWYFDDVEARFERTVSEILRFIGASPRLGEGAGVKRVNSSGEPRSRVLQSGVRALTRNELARSAIKRSTTYEFREGVRRRLLRRQTVDPALHAELAPIFAPDLAMLRDRLRSRPQGGEGGVHTLGSAPGWLFPT